MCAYILLPKFPRWLCTLTRGVPGTSPECGHCLPSTSPGWHKGVTAPGTQSRGQEGCRRIPHLSNSVWKVSLGRKAAVRQKRLRVSHWRPTLLTERTLVVPVNIYTAPLPTTPGFSASNSPVGTLKHLIPFSQGSWRLETVWDLET